MIKKTINIVSYYASKYGGNFIPSILSLYNQITDDYNVILSFPEEAKERSWINYLVNLGINVHFFNISKKRQMIADIKRINKNNNVSLLYTHFFSPLVVKLLYPFTKRIKLIIHIHSDFTGGQKQKLINRIKTFLANRILRKDAFYIFVSNSMYKAYNVKNSIHLANAYSPQRIPCKRFDINTFKKENGITDTDQIILFFGWSPYVKGVDVVINAFIKANQNNKKLIIVHKRDNGKQIIDDYLDHKIEGDYKNNTNIVFIPPQEDSESLYCMSDIFISSSRSEGFSYSILEAMINGNIIYMSDIKGTSWANKYDYVYDYPVEDCKSLTNLINKHIVPLKEDIQKRKIKLLKDYNINNWADTLKIIINKLLY